MVDATISRARMRGLACPGRAGARNRPAARGARGHVRFTPSAAHRYVPYRQAAAAAPRSGQPTPRAGDLMASTIYGPWLSLALVSSNAPLHHPLARQPEREALVQRVRVARVQ